MAILDLAEVNSWKDTVAELPADTQTVLVGQIQALEAQIREAEARLSDVAGQKADALKRHL